MTSERTDEDLQRVLEIAVDHPAYAGHFPGSPILPGAVLLDVALLEIERSRGIDLRHWRIASAKFFGPVRPGDELTLHHSAPTSVTIRFSIRTAGGAIAAGTLTYGD